GVLLRSSLPVCCGLLCHSVSTVHSFFFQAEDGIRYRNVTGVQTCALPIWGGHYRTRWLPLVSFKSIRLGTYRLQRCPVHQRWEMTSIVEDEDLTPEILSEADRYPASRIP